MLNRLMLKHLFLAFYILLDWRVLGNTVVMNSDLRHGKSWWQINQHSTKSEEFFQFPPQPPLIRHFPPQVGSRRSLNCLLSTFWSSSLPLPTPGTAGGEPGRPSTPVELQCEGWERIRTDSPGGTSLDWCVSDRHQSMAQAIIKWYYSQRERSARTWQAFSFPLPLPL